MKGSVIRNGAAVGIYDGYCARNGTAVKLYDGYCIQGGVASKIYQSFDVKARAADHQDYGGGYIELKEDGGGFVELYSTFYDSDPKRYYAYIDFYLNDPIQFEHKQELIKFTQTVTDTLHADGSYARLRCLNADGEQISYNYVNILGTNNNVILTANGISTISFFRLEVSSMLDASTNSDSYARTSWGPGAIYIAGQQINTMDVGPGKWT